MRRRNKVEFVSLDYQTVPSPWWIFDVIGWDIIDAGIMFLLIKPTVKYQTSYRGYINQLGDSEPYPFPLDYAHDDFNALVARLNDFSSGKGLADGMVPNSTFWLIEDSEIVGVSNIRHRLTDKLNLLGGQLEKENNVPEYRETLQRYLIYGDADIS